MRSLILSAIMGICLVLSPVTGACLEDTPATFTYDITAQGKPLGRLSLTLTEDTSRGRPAMRVATVTAIRAYLLGFPVLTLDCREEALIDASGVRTYRRQSLTNGESLALAGTRTDDTFHLRVTRDGKTRSLAIPRTDYVLTSLESPGQYVEAKGRPCTLGVLDFDTQSVIRRRFTWVKDEEIFSAGRPFVCKVIEYEGPTIIARRWVTHDRYGILIREKGLSRPYIIRLVEMQLDAPRGGGTDHPGPAAPGAP